MKKILTLASFITLANISFVKSQEIPDIVTDRPDVTESSLTVLRKYIQIESGFVYSKNKFKNTGLSNDTLNDVMETQEFLNAPGFLIRYGLTDKIELRLGAQLTVNKVGYSEPSFSNSTQTDIEGIEIAVKFKLAKQNKAFPSIAVITGSALPPVSTHFFSNLKLQPAVIFCFSNKITENFGAGYNLGVNFSDWFNTNTSSGSYSLSLNYSITDFLGMFGEIYGDVPFSKNKALNYIDGGFTVLLRKNLQLDFSGGYGLNSGATEYFLNTGISFRLPK